MSYEERVEAITMVAGFDASAETNIGLLVVTGADGKAEIGGAASRPVGAIGSLAPEDHGIRVLGGGIVPVRIGAGGVVAGAFIQCGAGGKAITQAAGPRLGQVQASADGGQTAWAEDSLAPVYWQPIA